MYNELINKQKVIENVKIMSNEYDDLKHDFRTTYIKSGHQSAGMFHLNEFGPYFKGDPLLAL